jgi:hypothetical protein
MTVHVRQRHLRAAIDGTEQLCVALPWERGARRARMRLRRERAAAVAAPAAQQVLEAALLPVLGPRAGVELALRPAPKRPQAERDGHERTAARPRSHRSPTPPAGGVPTHAAPSPRGMHAAASAARRESAGECWSAGAEAVASTAYATLAREAARHAQGLLVLSPAWRT